MKEKKKRVWVIVKAATGSTFTLRYSRFYYILHRSSGKKWQYKIKTVNRQKAEVLVIILNDIFDVF